MNITQFIRSLALGLVLTLGFGLGTLDSSAQTNLISIPLADPSGVPEVGVTVAVQLTGPNPRIVNGTTGTLHFAATHTTDASGTAWWTNLVWGNYLCVVPGDSLRFSFTVQTNTLGQVNVFGLTGYTNVPPAGWPYYTAWQIDQLATNLYNAIAAGGGGGGTVNFTNGTQSTVGTNAANQVRFDVVTNWADLAGSAAAVLGVAVTNNAVDPNFYGLTLTSPTTFNTVTLSQITSAGGPALSVGGGSLSANYIFGNGSGLTGLTPGQSGSQPTNNNLTGWAALNPARTVTNVITPAMFGAKGDVVFSYSSGYVSGSDDTTPLQAAFGYVSTNGGTLDLQGRFYLLNGTCLITNNNGATVRNGSLVVTNQSLNPAVWLAGDLNRMDNVNIYGPGITNYSGVSVGLYRGNYPSGGYVQSTIINNCRIQNFTTNVWVNHDVGGVWTGNLFICPGACAMSLTADETLIQGCTIGEADANHYGIPTGPGNAPYVATNAIGFQMLGGISVSLIHNNLNTCHQAIRVLGGGYVDIEDDNTEGAFGYPGQAAWYFTNVNSVHVIGSTINPGFASAGGSNQMNCLEFDACNYITCVDDIAATVGSATNIFCLNCTPQVLYGQYSYSFNHLPTAPGFNVPEQLNTLQTLVSNGNFALGININPSTYPCINNYNDTWQTFAGHYVFFDLASNPLMWIYGGGVVQATNFTALQGGVFTGSGSGLTNVPAAGLTGTAPTNTVPPLLPSSITGNAATASLASNLVSGASLTNVTFAGTQPTYLGNALLTNAPSTNGFVTASITNGLATTGFALAIGANDTNYVNASTNGLATIGYAQSLSNNLLTAVNTASNATVSATNGVSVNETITNAKSFTGTNVTSLQGGIFTGNGSGLTNLINAPAIPLWSTTAAYAYSGSTAQAAYGPDFSYYGAAPPTTYSYYSVSEPGGWQWLRLDIVGLNNSAGTNVYLPVFTNGTLMTTLVMAPTNINTLVVSNYGPFLFPTNAQECIGFTNTGYNQAIHYVVHLKAFLATNTNTPPAP